MSEQAWLDALTPGDQVIVSSGSGFGRVRRITTVVKRDKVKIVLATEEKFSPRDGFRSPREQWSYTHIVPATPEAIAEIREAQERRELEQRIGQVRLRDLSIATLRQMAQLVVAR